MKNFFSLLVLVAVAFLIGSTSVSAQTMAKHDQMASSETMSAKGDATMAAKPKLITLAQRPGVYTTEGLTLAAGEYVFEIVNENVAKPVGFYLQAADDSQVENSGLSAVLKEGETGRTGTVTLTPGTYRYSCPLNPTPHYVITVK